MTLRCATFGTNATHKPGTFTAEDLMRFHEETNPNSPKFKKQTSCLIPTNDPNYNATEMGINPSITARVSLPPGFFITSTEKIKELADREMKLFDHLHNNLLSSEQLNALRQKSADLTAQLDNSVTLLERTTSVTSRSQQHILSLRIANCSHHI